MTKTSTQENTHPMSASCAVAKVAFVAMALIAAMLMQTACSSGSSSASVSASTGTAEAASASAAQAESKYSVSIDEAVVGADYDGNPAIIVTFTWQNNSDEATSFAGALYPKCYQNGVQLNTAFVVDGIDSSGYTADVKPGAGTTVQLAYELTDQSPVEVEVGELISMDKTVLAAKTFEIA